MANTHSSLERAVTYLERAFIDLDSDRANAAPFNSLNSEVRTYVELELLLRERGAGATLREAVAFYLAHHRTKKLQPERVAKCADIFIAHQEANNLSPSHVATLRKHFRRFEREFGTREIAQIETREIAEWLARQRSISGKLWSAKTRTSNLGSLVSLSLFARDTLNAIPDVGKTEFQKVRRPKRDERGEVEIYTREEMLKLLRAALETDIDMIPPIVIGAFQGLRPAEIHAEGAKRRPLRWDAFIWRDKSLHITGQKVRSKANRDVPLQPVTVVWLRPFKGLKGEIWKHKQSHSKKMICLRATANVRSIYDGFRHSFASYRIKQLKGNLPELAAEMGNSPREIIDSYKRNVTDEQARVWFNEILPPDDYSARIKAALALRKPR